MRRSIRERPPHERGYASLDVAKVDQCCPTCFASVRLVRDERGIMRAPSDFGADLTGAIGLCAICGLPAVWLASGQLRRISLAELGALRPEIGRAFEAARSSMLLFATYTYELSKH